MRNSMIVAGGMGIIRSSFLFMVGTVFGVYITQNYQVLNIKKLFNAALEMAKIKEQEYRKPNGKGDNPRL